MLAETNWTVRFAEVIACLIFILMEDLNDLNNCLNLADVQLAEIRKKRLLFTKRPPGSFPIPQCYDRSRVSSPVL